MVRIEETPVGKGVFANRCYPATAIIGEITGEVVTDCPDELAYAFEIDEATQLNPNAPFCYLNHSCEPNCEFDWFEEDPMNPDAAGLYLIALRNILPSEELTIDYNWPASGAIGCRCRAAACRGWIVSLDELSLLQSTQASTASGRTA